jgi:hypothetical protein
MKNSTGARRLLYVLAITAACSAPDEPERAALEPTASREAAPSTSCAGGTLRSCVAGRCSISTDADGIPGAAALTLREVSPPSSLAGDVLVPTMCEVTVSAPVGVPLTLRIASDGPLAPGATAFRVDGDDAYAVESFADGRVVSTPVTSNGRYGVTATGGRARFVRAIGTNAAGSATLAALMSNYASRVTQVAHFDGAHLFVGNGSRVLVYSGIPKDPGQRPELVLGDPDLDVPGRGISASSFGGEVTAIWSDGRRLAVAAGNRVLVWNVIPRESYVPADLVLGQLDFSSQEANSGGLSGSTLRSPRAIDVDGDRLMIADTYNHRVLWWDAFPRTNGQAASRVVGQSSMSSGDPWVSRLPMYVASGATFTAHGALVSSMWTDVGASRLPDALPSANTRPEYPVVAWAPRIQPDVVYTPGSVFRAPGGQLGIVDATGLRLAMFRSVPSRPAARMDYVLGLPDATRYLFDETTNSSSLRGAQLASVSNSDTTFVVADGGRTLVWDTPPSYTYEPASRVVGQPGFTTNHDDADYSGVSRATLAGPVDVAVGPGGLAVADRDNNRVLIFASADDKEASVVVGQPDFVSFVPNLDQVTPSASRLSGPSAVALAGGKLVVADTENHRVLVWNRVPTMSGAPADLVLGQSDFTGRRPNRGRGDVAPVDGLSDAAADGFFYPTGVASDGERLFVADRVNNRVLVWRTFPTANGQPADAVIGQPDFTSSTPNAGRGAYEPTEGGLNLPTKIALVGTTLWVADTENNRVVRIDEAAIAPRPSAFLGQVDGSSNAFPLVHGEGSGVQGYPIEIPPPSASSVIRPRGVAVASGRVYVSEADSNRVHVFDSGTLASVGVLGQRDPTSRAANAESLGARSLFAPEGLGSDGTRLFVADAGNNRVVGHVLGAQFEDNAAATLLLGQGRFLSRGFNRSPGRQSSRPRAISRYGSELFVAESDRHRVVVMQTGSAGGGAITRVLGQPDGVLSLPNAGAAASASSLYDPRGVSADARHVVVADRGNHRVLIFDRASSSAEAKIVLGQSSFAAAKPNRGGAASAATLSGPEGVVTDGTRLFVADTGNHRVLMWRKPPTRNGQPADVVFGQSTMSGRQSNRGSGPGAQTLSAPTGLDIVRGALLVADTGNNRVLSLPLDSAVDGIEATAVLGQPDASSRIPASSRDDVSRLSGPAALTSDGTFLYVADRDLGRVLSFALPLSQGARAREILGLDDKATLAGCSGVVAERTSLFTTRLYASDTAGSRVLLFEGLSRLR